MPDKNDSCAGKPVRGAASLMSHIFLTGCRNFVAELKGPVSQLRRVELNTACVMFAASYWEAMLNEMIAISKIAEDPELRPGFVESLRDAERRLTLQDKWNLWVSVVGGIHWDSSVEPFQSFELIVALRNELVHYKADFFGKDETPSRKIKGLLTRFAGSSPASFLDDDVSTWVSDLLGRPALGDWILEHLDAVEEKRFDLLR